MSTARKGAFSVLKLMKYEFRKMRTMLLILLGGVVVLQAAFMVGDMIDDDRVVSVSVTLLTLLAFVVYFYIMVAGFLSYSRELSDKTGYMAFMTPVSSVKLIGSKLLFTGLTAIAVTALFAGAAWYDYTLLFKRLNLGEDALQQADIAFSMFSRSVSSEAFTLTELILQGAFILGRVMIDLLLFMCTAYLSITLGSTLLQAQKGFWRGVVTLAIFIALSFITNKVGDLAGGEAEFRQTSEVLRSLGVVGGIELAFAVAFAALSAWLLDRKVSL